MQKIAQSGHIDFNVLETLALPIIIILIKSWLFKAKCPNSNLGISETDFIFRSVQVFSGTKNYCFFSFYVRSFKKENWFQDEILPFSPSLIFSHLFQEEQGQGITLVQGVMSSNPNAGF